MHQTFQATLAALGSKVQAAPMSDGSKQTAAWCIRQLPLLYTKFQETSESRYAEEISRLVDALLKDVAEGSKASPEAHQLADSLTDQFQSLHAQFGLPALTLKPRRPSPSRSRRTK